MFAENNKRETELRQSLVSKQRRSAFHFYARGLFQKGTFYAFTALDANKYISSIIV